MIITLTGENTFAIAQAKRQIVEAFVKKHDLNGVEQIDAENLDLAQLPDLLQGASLFTPARLIVLGNLSANKELQEKLVALLPSAAQDNTIVIFDDKLDKRTKMYKFLKSKTNFKEFANLSEHQLANWAQDQAKTLGAKLEKSAVLYLVDRVNGDQWRLQQEITKLADFNPQITKQTIDELVEPGSEGNAFELLDAALTGKTERVKQLVNNLKIEEDPYKLFGLLSSQVYALSVAHYAGKRSSDSIAKDTGLHPFVVRKTQIAAKRFKPEQIAKMAQAVALADHQIKSTGQNPWQLTEYCLLKIASN